MPREVVDRGEPARVRFGRRVRDLRESAGLLQRDVAQSAGIDSTYLSGVENGRRNPTLDVIVAIAHALDVPVTRLFD